MKRSKTAKALVVLLTVAMTMGSFTATSLAYDQDFVSETHDVFKHTASVLAPGVDFYTNYAYAKDGKQMVYYVATADIGRDDVEVHSAYKGAQCQEFGMAKLTEQLAAANAKYQQASPNFRVVAGTNGDFYNMSTGQPSGAFVMDGVNVTANGKANNRPWFAIFADGTALCGANNDEWDAAEAAHGAAQEAVGGSQMLVVDGKDVTANAGGSYNTDRHSRTMVGVTADNKVVMTVLDGRQEPFSCGGSMHELAQIMLEAGCATAINLDGGGSTTFAARPEGESEVRVINRPSDGSERSISTGLLIASTATPSDVFDHAALAVEHNYVLPGSTVAVSAKGVSPAGTAADIPADVSYTATLGAVTPEGVFTSDGTVGDAVITMRYDGADVGSVTIHVLYPTALQFAQGTITVPYGKTVQLELQATCNDGMNPVQLRADGVRFTLAEPTIGQIDGFNFTAAEEGAAVTESALTATIPGTDLTAEATVKLGKGSEVLWDFEDGDVSGFKRANSTAYNYVWTPGEVSLASVGDGQVHSGAHALRVNLDYSVWMEGGYMLSLLSLTGERDLYGATKLGMWMYFPDEAVSLQCRLFAAKVTARDEEGKITEVADSYTSKDDLDNGALHMWNVGFVTKFEESGWHYASFDLSDSPLGYNLQGTLMQIYINDRDNAANNYNHLDYKSCNQNINFYIDDVTLDYSSAVDDREAPVFDRVTWADPTMSDAAEFTRGVVAQTTADTVSFGAVVHENTALDNYTGLDASTARAYIDGVEMPCALAGGILSVADVALADGLHTVKFAIRDRQGNDASVIREINVNAQSGKSTVKLVPHDPSLDKILMGSLYYVDLVATDIERVQSVSADLDLNNMSVWELDHMDVAEGFKASYVIKDADDKVAALTITRTGEGGLTGEQALLSIPIRTWELPVTVHDYGAHKGQVVMYPGYKASNELLPIDVRVGVDRGMVTFTDDATSTFSGKVQVDTELDSWFYNDTAARDEAYQAWNGGHDHRPETAEYYAEGQTNHVMPEAMPDQPATCTKPGYTGRTYCPVCHSIVDWGEPIPMTAHRYELIDGVLKCADCGALGTGVHDFEGVYYRFEDGVRQEVYTGLFQMDGAWHYAKLGVLTGGWVMVDDEWYYFDASNYAAVDTYDNGAVTFEFDGTGRLRTGEWYETPEGVRYYFGPDYYRHGWHTIEGDDYYFGDANVEPGYRYEGLRYVINSNSYTPQWYDFGDDGKAQALHTTGLLTVADKLYYLVNGISQTGLQSIDGHYYYFSGVYEARSGLVYVSAVKNNDLLPEGYYLFRDNHQMADKEFGLWQGASRYIENGQPCFAGLLRNADGKVMYIGSDCTQRKGVCTVSANKTNGILPEGAYAFGDDGFLVDNQFAMWQGNRCYMKDGQPLAAGPVRVDDRVYYIRSSCQPATGLYWVSAGKTNEILPEEGYYLFGDDGALLDGQFADWNGRSCYIQAGRPVAAGVMEYEGKTIYVAGNCQMKTGICYITEKAGNGILSEGYYCFTESDGLLDSDFGEWTDHQTYYFKNGQPNPAGAIRIGEDIYYIDSGCRKVTGPHFVSVTKGNGILSEGTYTFGEDGALVAP